MCVCVINSNDAGKTRVRLLHLLLIITVKSSTCERWRFLKTMSRNRLKVIWGVLTYIAALLCPPDRADFLRGLRSSSTGDWWPEKKQTNVQLENV